MRPTLVVVDAWRVLMRNGPQGGNIDDARDMHTVVATVDQVAADAFGCTLIGQKPENLPYLAMGEKRGLGHDALGEPPREGGLSGQLDAARPPRPDPLADGQAGQVRRSTRADAGLRSSLRASSRRRRRTYHGTSPPARPVRARNGR